MEKTLPEGVLTRSSFRTVETGKRSDFFARPLSELPHRRRLDAAHRELIEASAVRAYSGPRPDWLNRRLDRAWTKFLELWDHRP